MNLSTLTIAAGHSPRRGSKGYTLLAYMLQGAQVDPPIAFQKLNLLTIHARASELRKMGWPVQVLYRAHPELEGEEYPVYYLDDHFRHWCGKQAGPVNPALYEYKTGRGKFKTPLLQVIEGGKDASA